MPKTEETARCYNDLQTSNLRIPQDLPRYLASLYEVPLLTPQQEVHLFRKMNFLNFRAAALRNELTVDSIIFQRLDEIETHLKQSRAIRNQIIQANLRLVVSIARQFVDAANSIDDLISDGNVPLIRAVEIFDFTRGYRFSTYATWAVRNNFVRSAPRNRQRKARYLTGTEDLFNGYSDARISQREYEREHRYQANLISRLLGYLDKRERSIVMSRFGLDWSGTKKKFREISSQLEISTERVRQIAAQALQKLRTMLAETGEDCLDDHLFPRARTGITKHVVTNRRLVYD